MAVRYEALATVFVLSAICFLKRGYRLGACLVLSALIPVAAYALYAVANGGLALPDGVLIKARPMQEHILTDGVQALESLPLTLSRFACFTHVAAITVAMGVAYLFCTTAEELKNLAGHAGWLLAAMGTTVLQVACGQLGWFYRYEMYVMGIGFLALGICLGASRAWRRKLCGALLPVCCWFCLKRGYAAASSI